MENRKKIALFTIWREKNYGAEMQAYATIKILQELGHNVEMIDIRLSDFKHSTKKKIKKIITFISPCRYKFEQFWKKNIPTTRRYESIIALQKNPPISDVYIVGSDQVWNPEIMKQALPLAFLSFGNKDIKRISYASSFGSSNIENNPTLQRLIITQLTTFRAISCREKSGVNFLQEKFNITSANVLDPTLLFDNYSELIGLPTQKQTLVYYPLSPYKKLESFSKSLSCKLGLKYVNTNKICYLIGKFVWNRPSVEQWIRNIAESTLVVTPSFHGVAFSLIYKRNFIVVIKDEKRSSRITDLLSELDLLDRCFFDIEEVEKSRIWEKPINYLEVRKRLSILRNHSLNYLKNSLR